MPTDIARSRLSTEELVVQVQDGLVPVSRVFSYFTVASIADEDLKQYLHDPIAAISPKLLDILPQIRVFLVPYLERGNGRTGDLIVFERPPDNRLVLAARVGAKAPVNLIFAMKEELVADYHYTFFYEIAGLAAEHWPGALAEAYLRLLREELKGEVHGEVDEHSWHLKQGLLRRQNNIRRETKQFQDYASQSFRDTLTLYLHGTCCDIDVEVGPRQMPSRHLRRRLELLMELFPPPEGYAVFPEQLKTRKP